MSLASIETRRPIQVNTMRRLIDFEQLENAMHLASESVKIAQKCVQRAARMQRRRTARKPSKASSCRKARRRPKQIGPAPGYTPKELPPVGEKWVHIGDGTFVSLREYKRQQRRQDRGWND